MIVTDKGHRLEHTIIIDQPSALSVEKICSWCHEQFGKRFSIVDRGSFGPDGTWQCLLFRKHDFPKETIYEFSFDHERDAVMFALRWS